MDWKTRMRDLKDEIRVLNKAIPETTRAFSGLSKSVHDAPALDLKTKEYIAIGIALVQDCEDCLGWHVEALIRAGGTREELVEVLATGIQMGGGPALMTAARALAAWDQLAPESP